MNVEDIEEIVFPQKPYDELIAHCRRKISGDYHDDEVPERKAYGLIGGRLDGIQMTVTHVFGLRHNLRQDAQLKDHVDRVMEQYAVPSETPLEKRGWVADPEEVFEAQQICLAAGSELFGNYHTHRVAWDHDPTRETCTELDRQLAKDSGMWVFIVSMVDPDQPSVRAFFEADNAREATVRITR